MRDIMCRLGPAISLACAVGALGDGEIPSCALDVQTGAGGKNLADRARVVTGTIRLNTTILMTPGRRCLLQDNSQSLPSGVRHDR